MQNGQYLVKLIKQLQLLLHQFNEIFSRTTWISQYHKGKTSLDLNEARDDGVWGCSGIRGNIKQSAPRSRQITTPTPHHSIFYRLNAPPDAQPTGSKHLRQNKSKDNNRNQKSTANWSENATAATDAHTYVCTQLHTHIGMYAYRWTDNQKTLGLRPHLQGKKVCQYNWHSAGSLGWPFPVLKYKYTFQ